MELVAYGVPAVTKLQKEWELQLALIMSTDAPAHLKKELDKVLSLQGDIEVIEKALQATQTTINHNDAPPAALNTPKSLKNHMPTYLPTLRASMHHSTSMTHSWNFMA